MDKNLVVVAVDNQQQEDLQCLQEEQQETVSPALLEVTDFKVCIAVSYKGTAIMFIVRLCCDCFMVYLIMEQQHRLLSHHMTG